MKANRVVITILCVVLSFCALAQDTLQHKSVVVQDTDMFYTRYTFLPIKDYSLYHLDTVMTQMHKVNKLYMVEEAFYQQLSTEGSAHKRISFALPNVMDFSYQPNIYEALWFKKENIPFYNTKKAFSQLTYSNTLNSSRYFSVIHAQNIYKNLQIGLRYDVNYSDGSFDNSQVRNQFFNLTTRYVSPKRFYEAYAAFIRNRAMQNESGGLLSDSVFESNTYSSLSAYPVNISEGYSKLKSYEAYSSQKVNFGRYLTNKKFLKTLSLVYDLSFATTARIYYDTALVKDSLYTRRFSQALMLQNDSVLPLTFGVKYDYIIHSDKTNEERLTNMTPFFSIELPVKSFSLKVDGEYVLSSSRYKNNFSLAAVARFKGFYLKAQSLSKSVDYFYSHFAINNYSWSNAFEQETYTLLSSGLNLGKYIQIEANYYTITNMAYIGADFMPHQDVNVNNLIQLSLKHNIKIGRFEFLGNMCLQKLSRQEAIHLPVFQTKQTGAINFKLFKGKLATQAGVDLRYNTSYYADGYMPAMGAFYVQNAKMVGNYLFADAFVQAKIQRFKLSFSVTHPYAGLFSYKYYNTLHYPNENLQLRFSVSWQFWD